MQQHQRERISIFFLALYPADAGDSYLRVLSYFDPLLESTALQDERPPSEVPIIGFSATFSRHDGLALGSVFDRIVYHQDFLEMIKEQWYVKPAFRREGMLNWVN